jgi:GAF domain-containing protein
MSEDDLRDPDPVVQEARLQEIAELHLTDPEMDPELRSIAARAAESLGLPIGVVSIVLDQAQYFAAAHGLRGWLAEVRGTPVEWSFCANAVRSREAFVVENALANPLVSQSPLVTQEGVRCYAGIPLITSRGHVLGTLCVAGIEQHAFPPEDIDKLRALAADAVRRIEARRG